MGTRAVETYQPFIVTLQPAKTVGVGPEKESEHHHLVADLEKVGVGSQRFLKEPFDEEEVLEML